MSEEVKKFARMSGDLVLNIELATQNWVNSQDDPSIFIEFTEDNPAHVNGYRYNGFFYPVQPFNSWIRNEEYHSWDPPVSYPADGKSYFWNEDILNWQEHN